jgi:hypothetical protein
MSEVKIKKAKLVSDLFLYVEYEEKDKDGKLKSKTEDSEIPVHDDLKNAIQKLHKHLALLCEEVSIKGRPKTIEEFDSEALYLKVDKSVDDISDEEPEARQSKFTAKSFSIGGNGENEGVTISGMKKLKTGKVVNLNTPFTKWSDTEYPFIDDLSADIETCYYEVEQYLFHNKRAPEQQLSLFPETEEESLVEEAL